MHPLRNHQAARGFALELHVDEEIVWKLSIFQRCQQAGTRGEGLRHLHTAHLGGTIVGDMALHLGAPFVHLILDGLAYQRLVINHHYSDIFHFLQHYRLTLGCQQHMDCRAFPFFALAVDGAFHQFDHLLCDRKPESGSLNAVHPAVRLAREWLVHGCHIFRTHADAGI